MMKLIEKPYSLKYAKFIFKIHIIIYYILFLFAFLMSYFSPVHSHEDWLAGTRIWLIGIFLEPWMWSWITEKNTVRLLFSFWGWGMLILPIPFFGSIFYGIIFGIIGLLKDISNYSKRKNIKKIKKEKNITFRQIIKQRLIKYFFYLLLFVLCGIILCSFIFEEEERTKKYYHFVFRLECDDYASNFIKKNKVKELHFIDIFSNIFNYKKLNIVSINKLVFIYPYDYKEKKLVEFYSNKIGEVKEKNIFYIIFTSHPIKQRYEFKEIDYFMKKSFNHMKFKIINDMKTVDDYEPNYNKFIQLGAAIGLIVGVFILNIYVFLYYIHAKY